jgi:hypothetical protein
MDHYDRVDRLSDHVHFLQVQYRGSHHCGNPTSVNFILWSFLEFVLYCVHDIQMLHPREGISYQYKVLYHHS